MAVALDRSTLEHGIAQLGQFVVLAFADLMRIDALQIGLHGMV